MLTVLHTYSNHKWTGPADHAVNLAAWLRKEGAARVEFACGRRRGQPEPIRKRAEERGLLPAQGFLLDKHLSWRIVPDILSLRRFIARKGIDLVHSHQDNDNLTAVLAGLGGRLVRTLYDGELPQLKARRRFALRRTALLFTASERVRLELAAMFPGKPVEKVDVPVDLERFRPQPKSPLLLGEFGLKPDEPVGGIVARVQTHRRFELLLAALKIAAAEVPGFRFLIVGRGTHIDRIARDPVRRLGLERNVIFAGYRADDYVDVLNLMDYKLFLKPGSDGACRAAREALACGKPVIALRAGILTELIRDGVNGRLSDDTPAALAAAMLAYHRNADLRGKGGRAARAYAEGFLDPKLYVARVTAGYRRLARKGVGSSEFGVRNSEFGVKKRK